MQKPTSNLHEIIQFVLMEAHASWRYRWYALAVAWCIALVGAVLVFAMPNQYQANALVYADTDALTNPLLKGVAVQANVEGRLQVITNTLLSRPNLESVADQTGLSLRATTPQQKIALLDRLKASVQVDASGTRNLYDIKYVDGDPVMAQKVVQAFLQVLMNNTLGANSASTRTAQRFLESQVEDYNQRLNEAEKKLADYKKANIGYIPDQGGKDYYTRLQGAQAQLQDLEDQYHTLADARATMRQQMQNMVSNPGSAGIDPRIGQINQQLATYREQLNQLLLRYTEAYPDVVSTRRVIKQLEDRRDKLEKERGQKAVASVASDNPVYQEMQKQLFNAQVRMRTLATQIGLQKNEIARLKGKVARITDVETTLQRLTRNYNTTKGQYDELVQRLNTAQMSQAATQSGNNLKFKVVSPPVVPLLPVSPKRALLLLVAFLFALGIGGALAYFLHKIKPIFTSLKSLRDFSDYPVIGSFGLIVSQARRAGRRREIIGFCAVLGLLVVVVGVGLTFNVALAHMVQRLWIMGAA